ncbi:MAG TPA: cytochrome c [Steroidobacteraceae bacterium]|nr:cytochrome c [Steroidobacteraceae bacterium]
MSRLAAASAFALATLFACPGAYAQSAGEWSSPAQLWRATCSYCHDNGVARELRGAGLTPQAVATAVRAGPKAMPSFTTSQISDRELEQLAEWMNTQKAPVPQPTDRSTRESRHGSRERSRGP